MLVKCPECELQVSDKAISCPHCGYPLAEPQAQRKQSKKKNKRRRLPNGFGQISEIKGRNLRKPFRAMVTVGKSITGRPICKPLKPESFFETYNDAYAALLEYNRNPYDLAPDITVAELYTKWTTDYFKTLNSDSSIRTITSAWAYCSDVYGMRAKDLRARHIKGCMDDGVAIRKGEECHTTPNIKGRIKSMFNLMLDYALEYEIVDRNYARTFDISGDVVKEREDSKRGHITFTDDEMARLWANHENVPYADVILIQCYSGWRPQELGLIELENVNVNEWTFSGGIKTQAGKDRVVPIHTRIRPLVKKYYDQAVAIGSKYLFSINDSKTHKGSNRFTYDKYKTRFEKVVNELGLNKDHRPHDPRKQFVTMAKKHGVDEYVIKILVGHQISDVTEKVYTHRDVEWLRSEIEKIG